MASKKSRAKESAMSTKVDSPKSSVAPAVAPSAVVAKTASAAPLVAAPAAAAAVAAATPTVATPVAATLAKPQRDRSTIIALIAELRNPEADIARDAAVRLGTLPSDAEAVEALCQVVQNHESYFHPVVRAAAAATLGKLGDRRAVDALIRATADTMAETSDEAVKALGLLGDARALPALRAIIGNANGFYLEFVRRNAEKAIQRISSSPRQ